jgi:hypothetical protein
MNINFHHLKRYQKLIHHYKNNHIPTDGYYECHHITPKCFATDLNKILIDTPDNLVLLPARVHFIAHALLHKSYPDNRQLAHAFAMMIVNNIYQKRTSSSKLYEMAKQARSSAMKGVPRPEWVKEKLRKPKSNKINYKKSKTKEHSKNISQALKGKIKSQEHIKNMIESQRAFQKSRTIKMQEKRDYYRKLFSEANLDRKEFYKLYDIPIGTMKGYLRGLQNL